jgi:hypothetical protein
LAAFDHRHVRLFLERFLASLRAAGNREPVVAVTYGLRSGQLEALARHPRVEIVSLPLGDESVPRQRLRDFAALAQKLPAQTPLAYWDAGDVRFQARLGGLWDLVRAHPRQLLAAREPFHHPENASVARWTLSVNDPAARQRAFDLLTSRPCLNAGFAAGTADVLARYGQAAYGLLHSRALRGSTDWGDQTALNLYCHSDPEAWHEVEQCWNYCLCGRPRGEAYWERDGRIASRQGKPIHVVHGNALSLPLLRSAAGF